MEGEFVVTVFVVIAGVVGFVAGSAVVLVLCRGDKFDLQKRLVQLEPAPPHKAAMPGSMRRRVRAKSEPAARAGSKPLSAPSTRTRPAGGAGD